MKTHATIELLEARIAPAAVFHYTDVDGDLVTIVSSRGNSFDLMNAAHLAGGQLQTLDLDASVFGGEFFGAAITIHAVHPHGGLGDGKAHVGYLNAKGIDLGSVTIDGDLGHIDVGDGKLATPALGSLTVGSIYRFGPSTQDANGSEVSHVQGRLGALQVAGDVIGSLTVTGGSEGRIGSIRIGGSLMTEAGIFTSHGFIVTDGDIGPVTVRGSLLGGGLDSSNGGEIVSGGSIASLTVGGSIFGQYTSLAQSGGVLAAGDIGPVKVAHDVQGATLAGDNDAGFIRSTGGRIASLFIGGSLLGGTDSRGGAIFGAKGLGNVHIGGEVFHGSVVSGAAMGSVSIGGALTGGASSTGLIRSATAMGAVQIGGDIVGGVFDAGRIDGGTVARVTVQGSVYGGSGPGTGVISAGKGLGPVRIAHNLVGGSDLETGEIVGGTNVARVAIGGSVLGGSADFSGRIVSGAHLGPVTIHGDLRAGFSKNAAEVIATGRIDSVTIGGSVFTTGNNNNPGTQSASIRSGASIGTIVVKGSVTGSSFGPTIFSARDTIQSVSIGGSVNHGNILAGFDIALSPVNGDARIGSVKVGRDFIASVIAAGAKNLGTDDLPGGTGLKADNVNFGDAHDVSIGAGAPGVVSKIAAITIGGRVFGTLDTMNNTDSFGFVAEQIGVVKLGGFAVPLKGGAHNDSFKVQLDTDVTLHEI